MKKLLFVILVLASINCYSQLEVVNTNSEEIGKITPGGIETINCSKSGKYYFFNYKDAKFRTINEWKTFTLESNNGEFEKLYSLIQKGFEEMPEKHIMLETNKGFIFLNFKRFLGINTFYFGFSNKTGSVISFSTEYTQKQIDRLFGMNGIK